MDQFFIFLRRRSAAASSQVVFLDHLLRMAPVGLPILLVDVKHVGHLPHQFILQRLHHGMHEVNVVAAAEE